MKIPASLHALRRRLPRPLRPATPVEHVADVARSAVRTGARGAADVARAGLAGMAEASAAIPGLPRARSARSGAAAAKSKSAKGGSNTFRSAEGEAAGPAGKGQAWNGRPAKPRPRPRRAERKARRAAARERRVQGLSALGYVLLAGLILTWPDAEQGPPWRRLVAQLRGAPPHHPDPAQADAAQPDRGRAAPHPFRIPPRGWRDILTRVWTEFGRDRIMATAGGVTFFTLLALFPALAAFVSLYGLFSDVHSAHEQLRLLSGFMPPDILNFVGDEMLRIAGGHHGGLGVAFVVGLLVSLWSANGAVKALFDGLNVAYEERETRGFLKVNLISLAFTLGALVFVVVALAAIVAAPGLLAWFGLDAGSIWLSELRWPVMLLLLGTGLSLLYRWGPSRAHAKWVWLTPGSIFAAVMWLAASLLFSWYVANFGHFNRTYGSLGAVIGFMIWLWYSTIIVLVGAELNAEVEHQTAVDTTTGGPRPMGARGAAMADTLGRTRREVKAQPRGVRAEAPQLRPNG